MSTPFDPAQFLDAETTEAFVKRPPIPVGEYTAVISNLVAGRWQSKDKYDSNGQLKSGIKFDVELSVELPSNIKEQMGVDISTMKMRDSIMVDLNSSAGIDSAPGRNRQLRSYREALGMNKPGEPFRARDMVGKVLTVKVKHEIYQGEPQEQVGGVAAA